MDDKNIEFPDTHEPTEEEMLSPSYQLLKPKQQRLIHLYLSGEYSTKDIAALLNMSYNGVRNWLSNPEIKAVIDEYQKHEDDMVKQSLKALRFKALTKMNRLIDSPIDNIAFQAAKDILDRTGHKGVDKKEVNIEIYNFEQQMKEAISQSNAIEYIEADYEVIKNDKESDKK